jgi:cysteine desulfuration protein SufE
VKSPPEKLSRTLELLASIEDRSERIQLLIDTALRYEQVPREIAVPPYPEDRKVPGCESQVYVWGEDLPDGTLRFHFAVENPQGVSARALAVLLQETLSAAPLDEVAAVSPDIIYSIFGNELSMGKSLGLTGVVQIVAALAKKKAARAS